VDVVGFSIGSFIALQTFRYMTNGVGSLHLVSAAAPLEAGDYLVTMAGKQVFKLAKVVPALFVLLSYWQGLFTWLFSQCLISLVVYQRRWRR
jgi:pimeloyl-ACP methyl ester carboxylesterase